MEALVSRDLSQGLTTEAKNIHALSDRKVTLLGRIDHQIARSPAHAAILDFAGDGVARALQRDEICFRTTARQRAEALRSIIQQVTQPADCTRLERSEERRVGQ